MARKRKKVEIKHGINSCKTIDDYVKWKMAKGYIDDEGYPIKCQYCGCKSKIDTETVDTINGFTCEEKAICKNCGKEIGYWAYGSWNWYF